MKIEEVYETSLSLSLGGSGNLCDVGTVVVPQCMPPQKGGFASLTYTRRLVVSWKVGS